MQQGEGTTRGRRLPSPAMLVAVAALIAALAGTAVAVDKIRSKDIGPNAVRSKHIKRGQVKAKDTDVTKSRFATSLVDDNSAALTELNVSVKVKRGDLVSVHGFAVARDVDGIGGDTCRVLLDATAPGLEDQQAVLGFDTSTFTRRAFDGTVAGTTSFSAESAIDHRVPANGRFRLAPALAAGPLADCEIRERGLAVTVQR